MSEQTFTSADQAEAALAAALEAENSGQASPEAPVAPEVPANQPTPVGQPAQESPAQPDSFTDLNAAIAELPEEAQHLVRERFNQMQGDYTRKTQEIAEVRREAEQAVQFVQQLQSDPSFALEVRNEIQSALEAAGYSPEEARQAANQEVAETQTQGLSNELGDPLEGKIQEIEQKLAAFEADQLTRELENEFDRQDVAVRQAHPDWAEEDMQHVYALSYATGGNLVQAAELYQKEHERMIAAYLEGKARVNSTAPATPGATGPAQPEPEKFDSLLDPRLQAAAERMLRESYLGE
jgi:sulfite reductase alpha subunit-like flavoprotein